MSETGHRRRSSNSPGASTPSQTPPRPRGATSRASATAFPWSATSRRACLCPRSGSRRPASTKWIMSKRSTASPYTTGGGRAADTLRTHYLSHSTKLGDGGVGRLRSTNSESVPTSYSFTKRGHNSRKTCTLLRRSCASLRGATQSRRPSAGRPISTPSRTADRAYAAERSPRAASSPSQTQRASPRSSPRYLAGRRPRARRDSPGGLEVRACPRSDNL